MPHRTRLVAPRVHLPLRRLALCLDCEDCFEIGTATCPACGSDTWTALARFLDDTSAGRLSTLAGAMFPDAARRPTHHLLIVAGDRPALYRTLARELADNDSVTVLLDRRPPGPNGKAREGRERRWRNVDPQLRALGWAIVRAARPGERAD
jgi:hypothetical protein